MSQAHFVIQVAVSCLLQIVIKTHKGPVLGSDLNLYEGVKSPCLGHVDGLYEWDWVCLRQLVVFPSHTHTHIHTVGSFESENQWHRTAGEGWRKVKLVGWLVVGAGLLPGVTPATGDSAETPQPDGIYVSITTSQLCTSPYEFDSRALAHNVMSRQTSTLWSVCKIERV